MKERRIHIEPLSLVFTENKDERIVRIPKSQTQIKNIEQLNIITKRSNDFVPMKVTEEEDAFLFSYKINGIVKTWDQVKSLHDNEKLRALCNIANLYTLLATRVTFFLHPNNLLFDHNLMPKIVYRGVRNIIQPYEMNEADVLKQYKCLIVAMFSEKYTFDDLYKGTLEKATLTRFEQDIVKQESFDKVIHLLKNRFQQEQQMTEKEKKLVPTKRFKLFKGLTIGLLITTFLLVALLSYTAFVKIPYQEKLLEANEEFLASDYTNVIQVIRDQDVEKLPQSSKYILAYSYVKVEQLSDDEKETIMKNINLKSDKRYLLYWIYNGMGNFERTIDLAKYMDDPRLIMYALIKKTEQVKNDPDLSGAERDEEVGKLRAELEKYADEYDVMQEEEEMNQEIDEEVTSEDEKAKSSKKEKQDKAKESKRDKK